MCSSEPAPAIPHGEASRQFGTLLAKRGIGLVYGGGSIGLMGLVADGACAAIGYQPQPQQQWIERGDI